MYAVLTQFQDPTYFEPPEMRPYTFECVACYPTGSILSIHSNLCSCFHPYILTIMGILFGLRFE